ncbi:MULTISPECIES: 4Fe-4S single cluster domain-containing protein [unclassified Alteromonas]|uniref:4Fe-4S single cluster domain-containing protein n=1 Tax=unclassified Alteromonas TaxID=2614992 RepID=UPI001EF266E3|nr:MULTISPECIES: 4Fe-4S single cluster domain-containing protein [unclassified Alteromonas]MCG7638103.1 radical SAM protein [Alteromonas sp. CNT1-28]MCG7815092.1 radical SAM protein [Alteromonas sp. MCA-1]
MSKTHTYINLYHREPEVSNLGPGTRYVLWVQGCDLGCKGCLVPDSWNAQSGTRVSLDLLIKEVLTTPKLRGVTISGGEPLMQIKPVIEFCAKLRRQNSNLDIIVYTGYELEEAALKFNVQFAQLASLIDLLITGRFKKNNLSSDMIRGSSNQKLYFLTNSIIKSDLRNWSDGESYHVYGSHYFVSGIPIKDKS